MLKKYLVKSNAYQMVIYWTGDKNSLKEFASIKWNCPKYQILTIKELQ